MTPNEILATFFSLSFLALFAKGIWAVRGWVETEKTRTKTEEQIAAAIVQFAGAQREANVQVAARLADIERLQRQQSVTLRAMWRQFGAVENESQNEAPA